MCIMLLLSGVFCKLLVRSRWLIVIFKSSLSLLIFGLLILPIIDRVMLKSLTVIVALFISSLLVFVSCILRFSLGP